MDNLKKVAEKSSPELPFSVLILNASHDMAVEMTACLEQTVSHCQIIYVPSITLARLMLSRRNIDLVISSSVLPDGSVQLLKESILEAEYQPDLIVVGLDAHLSMIRDKGRLSENAPADMALAGYQKLKVENDDEVSTLGADIRNDLNNPLQEIVAMVYVAQVDATMTPETKQALGAIDQAAKSMSGYINDLEDKIRSVVTPPTGS